MKTIVLNICFVLCAFWAWNQKAKVQLIVTPEEVGINQTVTVTIKSNVEGDIVENWPSNFIKGYGVQSQSQYIQNFNSGKMEQEHTVIFSGNFNKAGKYKFGPFYVKAGNKTYKSNSVTINVITNPTQNSTDDITNKQLRQPAFGIIESSSVKIYEGEPLVLSGRVYSKERTFGRPILRRSFEVDGVNDFYPLQQSESWETVTIKRKNFESFAFERKVMFPVGSGTLSIQPFEIYLPYGSHGFNVLSSVPVVEIIPLPPNPPVEFIGAVGEFEVAQNYVSKTIKQGDIIQIDVVVSGRGNLHAIETPVLPLPKGMSTYGDAEVKEDYVFNTSGAEGKVTYTYHVQVTKEGEQTIQPVKIAYFNPKEEKYISVEASKATKVVVQENPKFEIDDETNPDAASDQLADQKNLRKKSSEKRVQNNWIWYGAGGLILVAAGLFFLVFRPKKKEEEKPNPKEKEQKISGKAVTQSEVKDLVNQTAFYLREKHNEKFYATFEKGLIMLLKFKLKQPENSTLMRSELLEMIKQNGDPSAPAIQQLLEKCDYARYGMIASEEEQELLMKELERLI